MFGCLPSYTQLGLASLQIADNDTATVLVNVRKMDSHSSVLRYQMCAFLLTLAAVYYLAQVAVRY
jgi:hypothetical protein